MQPHEEHTMTDKVAMIGLGNMGKALATALVMNGFEVTVWDRTPARAEPLIGFGAAKADSVTDAVNANDIILVCIESYKETQTLFEDCGALAGKIIVQLTRGTPLEGKTLGEWAINGGARYLDGTILGHPSEIGRAETMLAFAGDVQAWESVEYLMGCLGGASVYLGNNLTAPAALEAAITTPSLMAMMGLIQSAHILVQSGFDMTRFPEILPGITTLIEDGIARQASALMHNEFDCEDTTLGDWANSLEQNIVALGGHSNLSLLSPIRALLNGAVEAGYADQEISATIKVLSRPTDTKVR